MRAADILSVLIITSFASGCVGPEDTDRWDPVLGPGCPPKEGPPTPPGEPDTFPRYAAVWFLGAPAVTLRPGEQVAVPTSVVVCPDDDDRTIPMACTIGSDRYGREANITIQCPDSVTIVGGETEANFTILVSVDATSPEGSWGTLIESPGYWTEQGILFVRVKDE